MEQIGGFEGCIKKEILGLICEKNKFECSFGGICDMVKVLLVIWVVDMNKEYIVVGEVCKLGILVIVIFDMNCDFDEVDYLILGNDDVICLVVLLIRVIVFVVVEGLQVCVGLGCVDGKLEVEVVELLVEWE